MPRVPVVSSRVVFVGRLELDFPLAKADENFSLVSLLVELVVPLELGQILLPEELLDLPGVQVGQSVVEVAQPEHRVVVCSTDRLVSQIQTTHICPFLICHVSIIFQE